jgi:transcriptional regulator with XRE-family HTH domain
MQQLLTTLDHPGPLPAMCRFAAHLQTEWPASSTFFSRRTSTRPTDAPDRSARSSTDHSSTPPCRRRCPLRILKRGAGDEEDASPWPFRQRQVHGLSHSQLVKLAKLSLKYVGEIERGGANVSMDALERLTTPRMDPFELPLREQDTLPEGVRTLLLVEQTPHAASRSDGDLVGADVGRRNGPAGRAAGHDTQSGHLARRPADGAPATWSSTPNVASTTSVRCPTTKRSCDTSAWVGVVG